MSDSKKQTFLHGTALLAMATAVVKLIGALYKIPLNAIIGVQGFGYFNTAYQIYNVLLMISTAGLPVAMSRMISQASSLGNYRQVRKIYTVCKTIFLTLGIISAALMMGFSGVLAQAMGQPNATAAIAILAPSSFLICLMSTYRGFFQGQSNMKPTSVSQVMEAVVKLIVGIAAAVLIKFYTDSIPLAAGGAIFGVTVSCLVSSFYLNRCFRNAYKDMPVTTENPDSGKDIAKGLLAIAIPITIGSAGLQLLTTIETGIYMAQLHGNYDALTLADILTQAQNYHFTSEYTAVETLPYLLSEQSQGLYNYFDTFALQDLVEQARLCGYEAAIYGKELGELTRGELLQYVTDTLPGLVRGEALQFIIDTQKGVYDMSMTIFNMPCAFITPITISIIPAITAQLTVKDRRGARSTAHSAARVTALIAMPCAAGLFVLAEPVTGLLGGYQGEMLTLAANLMRILAVCIMFNATVLLTNAIMQAHGHVILPVVNMFVGGILKLVTIFILTGNPKIGIIGTPIGSLLCYASITVLNLVSVRMVIRRPPAIAKNMLRGFLSAAIMGAGAYGVWWGLKALGMGSNLILCAVPILVGVVIYLLCAVKLRAITRKDCLLLPKGEKIANLLHL